MSGRVVEALAAERATETTPVAGAWVELTPLVGRWHLGDLFFQGRTRPDAVRYTTTAADGTFSLQAPEVGMWRLTVGAEDRVSVQLSLVPLFRDVELDDAVLAADHGVTVRVVDPKGRPVSAAAVLGYGGAASRRGRNGLPEPTWHRATELKFTDDDGRARLSGYLGESLRLQVAEPDHPSISTEVRISVATEAEIQLDTGRGLTVFAGDAGGSPLASALIWLDDLPFPVGWTGETGLTSMVLPQTGVVRFRGHTESGEQASYELSTSSPIESLSLPFRRSEPLRGRVLRQGTQEPVPGALVWSWYLPDRAVRSDSDGWFRLTAVETGAYLSAVRQGYRPGGMHLPQTDRDHVGAAVVQLQAVGSLAGLVVDTRGEAVAGLGLRLARRGASWSQESWPFRSQPDGTFAMHDLPVDEELLVTLGGTDDAGKVWAEVVRHVEPLEPGELRTGVLLQADRGLAAMGWVVDQSESPVVGARVRLMASDARRETRLARGRETRSEDDGSWQMAGVHPGLDVLTVDAPGFGPAIVPGVELGSAEAVESAASETVDLGTVVLVPGSALSGWVVDFGGRPVSGAEVRAWEAARPVVQVSAVTDEQGRFVVRDLRPGARLILAADHPEFLWARQGPIEAPPSGELAEEIEIVLERGSSIRGRVTDEAGQPIYRAGIALFAQGGGGEARSGQSTAVTDREGRFLLDQVPAGPATLQVAHREYPNHSQPVELLPSHLGATEVHVVLRETAGRVRGLVRDTGGAPVGAAMVLLPGDGVLRAARGRTDAEGAFEIGRVDPGRRELVVHHGSFASYRTELDVGPSTWVEIELDPGVSVSGSVVDGGGAPVAGARIDTTPLDAAGGATREGRCQRPTERGRSSGWSQAAIGYGRAPMDTMPPKWKNPSCSRRTWTG